jgi:hypothetical protein
MITKEQRERDRAICERVETPLPWRWWTSCSHQRLSSDVTGKDGDVAYGHTHKDGCGDIAIRECDMAHVENAVNRLPAYIADAEEMERRIERVERLAREAAEGAARHKAQGEHSAALVCGDVADAYQRAAKILRGEP